MLKKIGKEWTKKEEGGMFTADHLSPSQLNKNIDQWFFDYCKLTAAERKKLKPNMKMIFGGLVGQAMQDMIVPNLKMIFGGLAGQGMQDMITENLTLEQVMKGKK